MLFDNHKAVVDSLYHLLGKDNFVITGSLADYVHFKDKESDILIGDIDILITEKKQLEKLNPYVILKRRRVFDEIEVNATHLYIYQFLNVKIEVFLKPFISHIEEINFLNKPMLFVSKEGRIKGLKEFIRLASRKNPERMIKYKKRLKAYQGLKQ